MDTGRVVSPSYNNLATVERIGRHAVTTSTNAGHPGEYQYGYRQPTACEMSYFLFPPPYSGIYGRSGQANSAIAKYLGSGEHEGESSRSYTIGVDATPVDDFQITETCIHRHQRPAWQHPVLQCHTNDTTLRTC